MPSRLAAHKIGFGNGACLDTLAAEADFCGLTQTMVSMAVGLRIKSDQVGGGYIYRHPLHWGNPSYCERPFLAAPA